MSPLGQNSFLSPGRTPMWACLCASVSVFHPAGGAYIIKSSRLVEVSFLQNQTEIEGKNK